MPDTLSDRLVSYLNQLGVEYVFGIPGGHNAPLYAALARSQAQGGCAAIMARHETGAVFMADGYARETGKLGVCCATTGPGATNLLTGVASAYADHIPLLVITAQTLLSHFAWGAFQECSPDTVDTLAMFTPCTRYNTLISHPGQFDKKIYAALNAALRAPQGPAHLSIPVDLLRAPLADTVAEIPPLRKLSQQDALDCAALEDAWQILQAGLRDGRQIVLLIGQDCPGAAQEIEALAEFLNAPMISTQGGKTWVNPHHPLARGVFGFAGHASARRALAQADLILALGTTLGQWATANWDSVLLNQKLIHLHPISDYFARSEMAQLHVQAPVKSAVRWLLERAQAPLTPPIQRARGGPLPASIEIQNPDLYQTPDPDGRIQPARVIALLEQHAPVATRYLSDIGNWLAWTIHYSFPPRAGAYRLSVATAAMGWGIGAAVGTAFGNPFDTCAEHSRSRLRASPDAPVVCYTGDGCFLMHGNELSVAAEHRLPVIFVILNDQSYGMVRHRYQQVGSAPLAFDLPITDFSLLAQALGAAGYTLRNAEELEQFDFAGLFQNLAGPVVLDLRVDAGIVPPLGMF